MSNAQKSYEWCEMCKREHEPFVGCAVTHAFAVRHVCACVFVVPALKAASRLTGGLCGAKTDVHSGHARTHGVRVTLRMRVHV